jgi:hypothetical protein
VLDTGISHSNPSYIHSLASIGASKKMAKGPVTTYGAFLGKKLEEENDGEPSYLYSNVLLIPILGKASGSKMTLPNLLKTHSKELKAEFDELSCDEKNLLRTQFLQAKEERNDTPSKLSNVAISKAVDSKIQPMMEIVSFMLLSAMQY